MNKCADSSCKYNHLCWFCLKAHPACKCPSNPVRFKDTPYPYRKKGQSRCGFKRECNYHRSHTSYQSQPPNTTDPTTITATNNNMSQQPSTTTSSTQSKSNRARFNNENR